MAADRFPLPNRTTKTTLRQGRCEVSPSPALFGIWVLSKYLAFTVLERSPHVPVSPIASIIVAEMESYCEILNP